MDLALFRYGIFFRRHAVQLLAAALPVFAVSPQGLVAHSATTDDFALQINATVPQFLRESGVPGATVALIRNGRVIFIHGYGYADRARKMTATPATVFNVGSISKTLTAWGVMRLVERGIVGLDDPVERYLRRWHLPFSSRNVDGVTIRRLLSHTAGLSLPSVHEYLPDELTPSLPVALADSTEGVRQVADAGTTYSYSGGGYEILQLLIEDVTGRSFAQFMTEEVLRPLGMRNSTFDASVLDPRTTATAYDSSRAIPRHHYVGLAAAGLYTTAEDLAKFVTASMRGPNGEAPGRGVVSPTAVALMQSPAPGADAGFGFRYGFGYNLFPLGNTFGPLKILGDGVMVPGHMGQNTGWGAVIWMNPGTGDGFVMLTNHSSGFEAYRWALCDWIRAIAIPSFGYICDNRDKHALGPMGAALYASEAKQTSPRDPFVDSLARAAVKDTMPGIAILVMRDGALLHSVGYGRADLATGDKVTERTPYYLASMSKQFTAYAILRLAEQRKLALTDPLSKFVPELTGPMSAVTVRQLLTHSSGVPDYFSFITSWAQLTHLDNAAVIDTLRGKPLDFPAGSKTAYSNSGYVLLAAIIERVTKLPFATSMETLVFKPAGMFSTIVLDTRAAYPRGRAIGYDTVGGQYRMSDYGVLENSAGRRTYFDLRTTGAGGMYSSLHDLAAWVRTLESTKLIDAPSLAEAFRVQERTDNERGVDTVMGYGYGWIVSHRYGTEVVWHDGGFAGFHNIIVRVPSRKLTVVVLCNSTLVEQHRLAVAIADHYMK